MHKKGSWLPAITVTVLLAAALVAPARRLQAGRDVPALDVLYYAGCSVLKSVLADGTAWRHSILPGNGVVQPFGEVANVASCSLQVEPARYAGKRQDFIYWDPVALTPMANMVALRSRTFYATYMPIDASRFDLLPPVITRTVPGLGEPPPAATAVQYLNLPGSHDNEDALFDDEGPADSPAAMGIRGGAIYEPMGGRHPVFLHALCGGDAALQTYVIAQSVVTTDAELYSVHVQVIQKFRVPVATSLRWVELVFKPTPYIYPLDYGQIIIADATGQAEPPLDFGSGIAQAQFLQYPSMPGWFANNYDFNATPVLSAQHDYWLVINTYGDYKLGARLRTAGDSPYFQNGIRELFVRNVEGEPATLLSDRSLDFKIIGVPAQTVGVETSPPTRASLRLAIAPNPSRGAASVTWAGARDDVRFEVLDARGRRVSSGAAGIGASGSWSWNGRGDDGRELPAGVYFVRARDGAGRSASSRLTLVR